MGKDSFISVVRTRRPSPPAVKRGTSLRLLLVEDAVSDALLIRRALEAEWVHTETCVAAKAAFRDHRFDAIVCDLALGATRGTETLSAIRQFAPATPLVVVSGGIERDKAHALIEAGADSYLEKDELAYLEEAVQVAIAQRRRLQASIANRATDRLERELYERASAGPEIFDFIQNGVSDGLWYWDLESGEEWFSPRFVEALGLSMQDVAGKTGWWRRCMFAEDLERTLLAYEKHLAEPGHACDQLVRYRHADGSVLWFRCRARAIRNQRGEPIRMIGCQTDVTALKEAEARLRVTAMTDDLTGLPNGRAIQGRCAESLARARRRCEKAAVLYFDLDRFKRINDQLGHDAGDRVIAVVATRARAALRDLDTLARLHGDEFLIVAEGIDDTAGAEAICRRLLSQVCRPVEMGGVQQPITVSVGAALYPDHGDSYEDLRMAADKAMLRAKRSGRNAYAVATGRSRAPHTASSSTGLIEGALWGALGRRELTFHFQPQRRLQSGAVTGYEALMRWSGGSGTVSPEVFIPALVRIGAMPAVTRWSIDELCRTAKASNVQVSMNVSPAQLELPQFQQMIETSLASHALSPALFELEVIEQRLPEDDGRVLEVLAALSKLGLGIALDDFGKGYSSFDRLEQIPLTKLKLDKTLSFREGTLTRSVPALVKLAADRGVPLVAEGIETQHQRDALINAGVELGQGYFLGRPAALESDSSPSAATK